PPARNVRPIASTRNERTISARYGVRVLTVPRSATRSSTSEKVRNERRVPIVGIKKKTVRSTTRMDPTVERAYSPPPVEPTFDMAFVASRRAKGGTQPNRVTG